MRLSNAVRRVASNSVMKVVICLGGVVRIRWTILHTAAHFLSSVLASCLYSIVHIVCVISWSSESFFCSHCDTHSLDPIGALSHSMLRSLCTVIASGRLGFCVDWQAFIVLGVPYR